MTDITTESQMPGTQDTPETLPGKKQRASSAKTIVLVVLLLLVLLLGAAFWYQQQQFSLARQQLEQQLALSASAARHEDEKAQQALAAVKRQESRVSDLQNAFNVADTQLQSLEQALQIATDNGSDLMLLNDIDRLVVIAQQQLQLSGNVGNAIIALESAQS